MEDHTMKKGLGAFVVGVAVAAAVAAPKLAPFAHIVWGD
jgi:hypothetical protein